MKSLQSQYRRNLVLGIVSLLFVILVVTNVITYFMIKSSTELHLGVGTQSTSIAIAQFISYDIDGYRNFLETRDQNSDYYRRMQNYFSYIKRQSNIRFIYTINRVDETHTEFILDAEPIGSDYHSSPGDPEEENTVTLQVFNTKKPALLPPTKSPFGTLLGSSAPIFDERGGVIGVVGVDIDSGMVFITLRNLFIVLIVACFFMLCMIGFLLMKVSDSFLEPLLKDKLTGAYNKRYSETLLQKGIDRALESKREFSALMLDLDHFKNVNDTYGHNFGDVVLTKTSALIQECLRRDDFLIRYGGEEFLVLLFDLSEKAAEAVAERIRINLEACEIYNEKENVNIKITISIGVAALNGKKISGEDLVNKADTALYKAKETRNAVAVAT